MKCLMVAVCLVVAVSVVQADSFSCRRIGYRASFGQASRVPVLGNHVYVADDAFGLRITDAGELQSPAEGGYSGMSRTSVYLREMGGALLPGGCVGCAGGGLVVGAVLTLYGLDYDGDPDNGPARVLGVVGLVSLAAWPAISGWGAYRVGEHIDPGGSLWGAIGLSYAGAVIGFALGAPLTPLVLVTPILGSAVGAVVGYNLSSGAGSQTWQRRFGSPTAVVLPDSRTAQGSLRIQARVLSVTF